MGGCHTVECGVVVGTLPFAVGGIVSAWRLRRIGVGYA
jgi:hypothetical protein